MGISDIFSCKGKTLWHQYGHRYAESSISVKFELGMIALVFETYGV
jgi:hypothetical protein